MDKEVVTMILQFLERVQLNGAEVAAFNKCREELTNIINKEEE